MSTLECSAVGFVILGLLQLARLVLADSLGNLDWLDRLGRFLLDAAFVCLGAAQLTAAAWPRLRLGSLPTLIPVLSPRSGFHPNRERMLLATSCPVSRCVPRKVRLPCLRAMLCS